MVSRIEVGWRQGEKEGTIPVDVVYSKRRTIGLEVQADGKVLIRAPKGITKKVLMDFVNDRQEWIVEKWFLIEKHRRKKAESPKPDYEGHPEIEAFYRRAARKKDHRAHCLVCKAHGCHLRPDQHPGCQNALGKLQWGRQFKLSLETDPYAAGNIRLRSSPRTCPQKTDEPLVSFLGRGRKSAAGL